MPPCRRAPRPSPRGALGRGTLALAALLVALGVAPYASTLGHGPTYDDHHHVTAHPLLAPTPRFDRLVSARYLDDAFPDQGRPTHLASLLLDRAIYGDTFAGHHATNALLHGLVVALVFALLLALEVARAPAAIGAALFAVHPACTEAVAAVSHREDVLVAALSLSALLAARAFLRQGRAIALALALVTFGLALGAKESALVTPLLLAFLATACPSAFRGASRARVLALAAGAALPLAAFATLQLRLGAPSLSFAAGGAGLEPAPALALWASAPIGGGAAIAIEALRAGRVLVGAPLSAVHDPAGLDAPLAAAAGAVALLALLGLGAWAWRKERLVALAIGWFFLATLPVLPSAWLLDPIADRYLYVPAAGVVSILGAWLADRARPRLAGLVLAAAMSAALAGTLARVPVWRDDVSLFTDAARHAPRAPAVHVNLGAAHLRRGELERAEAALERAVRLDDTHLGALYDLGLVAERRGDREAAAEAFARASHVAPRRAEVPLHERAFDRWMRQLHALGRREELARAVRAERRRWPDSRPARVWWARLSPSER